MRHVCIVIALVTFFLTGCQAEQPPTTDMTTWDEQRVYAFLEDVQQHVRNIPLETASLQTVVSQYERYFAPALSKTIVDSLYVKSDSGWRVPDSDGGYIFTVPSKQNKVTITYSPDTIVVKETFEIGMYDAITYTIGHEGKRPLIVGWTQR